MLFEVVDEFAGSFRRIVQSSFVKFFLLANNKIDGFMENSIRIVNHRLTRISNSISHRINARHLQPLCVERGDESKIPEALDRAVI